LLALTGRSIVAAIAGGGRGSTVRGRGVAAAAVAAVTNLSAAGRGGAIEVRLCSARACVPHICMHPTANRLLQTHYHHRHTAPGVASIPSLARMHPLTALPQANRLRMRRRSAS